MRSTPHLAAGPWMRQGRERWGKSEHPFQAYRMAIPQIAGLPGIWVAYPPLFWNAPVWALFSNASIATASFAKRAGHLREVLHQHHFTSPTQLDSYTQLPVLSRHDRLIISTASAVMTIPGERPRQQTYVSVGGLAQAA